MRTQSLPLSALLSAALIAYTGEFERQLELRRAKDTGREPAPTLAMWSNVLRFVGDDGIEERKLPALSGISKPVTRSMVACLERHGWVEVTEKTIRLTIAARKLAAVWESAAAETERVWQQRYGANTVASLREVLATLVDQFEGDLPHYPMALAHRGGTPSGR